MDLEVARHWVGRYGPYVIAVVAARLTVDRLLHTSTEPGNHLPPPADLALLEAAFEVLGAAVELAAQADPAPDPDAEAAFRTALDCLRRAGVTFAHPARQLDTVRELLAEADRGLLTAGHRLTPSARLVGASSGARQLRYSDGT